MGQENGFGAKPVSVFELMHGCIEQLESGSGISFFPVQYQDFYNRLNELPDANLNTGPIDLDCSFTSCIGGTFRSARMARFLEQKGVKLANRKCRTGYTITDITALINSSHLTEEGHLLPQGFENPIKNLFIGIEIDSESSDEGCLLPLITAIYNKQCQSQTKLNLDIYIVDGDESETATLYREYRAYDPELDGEPAPPTPNTAI